MAMPNHEKSQKLTHIPLLSGPYSTLELLPAWLGGSNLSKYFSWCAKHSIFTFGFGVPLYTNADAAHWGKWSVLFVHTLVLTAVYSYTLFVHNSKWKDKLPPRPLFYNYVIVMFIANVMGLFACGLAGIIYGFGLWLYNFIVICRHSLYLPFLYATFLANFFEEEDWLLDSEYYSEMKDAGFFDTEWD
ncbi:hypothetical protein CDL12_24375 [Handroanthus impetiginosus]|uniref:Uncharacterized protein n=1 Tax=Handroanthus impetiginosus TaxID=429701 RepID=A0A2G9GCT3_9LAMI|nr:hypothetical protein CDL12_24375 [Handroanthus impetiginosus]